MARASGARIGGRSMPCASNAIAGASEVLRVSRYSSAAIRALRVSSMPILSTSGWVTLCSIASDRRILAVALSRDSVIRVIPAAFRLSRRFFWRCFGVLGMLKSHISVITLWWRDHVKITTELTAWSRTYSMPLLLRVDANLVVKPSGSSWLAESWWQMSRASVPPAMTASSSARRSSVISFRRGFFGYLAGRVFGLFGYSCVRRIRPASPVGWGTSFRDFGLQLRCACPINAVF